MFSCNFFVENYAKLSGIRNEADPVGYLIFVCRSDPDSGFSILYDPDKIYSRVDSDSRILGQIPIQFIPFRVRILVFLCRSGSNLFVFGFGFSNSCADTDSIHSYADLNY